MSSHHQNLSLVVSGIQPNKYITHDEDKDVSSLLDKIQKSRLKDIVFNSDGVSRAECRNET